MHIVKRFFAALGIVYFIGAFITLEPNVFAWKEISRFALVYIGTALGVILALL